jgi:hypothetical protein
MSSPTDIICLPTSLMKQCKDTTVVLNCFNTENFKRKISYYSFMVTNPVCVMFQVLSKRSKTDSASGKISKPEALPEEIYRYRVIIFDS